MGTMEALRPTPNCVCEVRCSCNMIKNVNHKDSKHVICFLKGLNETYNIIKTQTLLMEPLP